MIYEQGIISFDKIFFLSIRYAWRALVSILWLVVIFTLMISAFHYVPPLTLLWDYLFGALIGVISIFLFVVGLILVDRMLRQQTLSYAKAIELAGKKILKIYLVLIVYMLGGYLWFVIGRWLIFSLLKLSGAVGGIAATFVIGIPLILFLIYLYLAIPILSLYPKAFWRGIYESVLYAHRNFLMMLCLYAEVILMLFIASSYTRHGEWLLSHHLLELVDLVTFCVIIPALMIQTLLILNNSRLKENSHL